MVLLCVLALTWNENYGDTNIDVFPLLKSALHDLVQDKKIVMLGILQSMFEGCMYTFVFLWTPSLEGEGDACILPLGCHIYRDFKKLILQLGFRNLHGMFHDWKPVFRTCQGSYIS